MMFMTFTTVDRKVAVNLKKNKYPEGKVDYLRNKANKEVDILSP